MSEKAKVLVQTFSGVVKTVNASTPADAAEQLGIPADNSVVTVNSSKGSLSTVLRNDDFVSFSTGKVTSGRR